MTARGTLTRRLGQRPVHVIWPTDGRARYRLRMARKRVHATNADRQRAYRLRLVPAPKPTRPRRPVA